MTPPSPLTGFLHGVKNNEKIKIGCNKKIKSNK
jgi:hypothetical protein